jgi:DNA modification methylase
MCGAFNRIIEHGMPDCHILINLGLSHKNRQVDMYWLEWLMYCSQTGWPVFGWYVWDKLEGLPGNFDGRLAFAHEFLFHFNRYNNKPNKWIATKYTEQSKTREQKTALRETHGNVDCVVQVHSPDKFGQAYRIPDSVIRLRPQKARDAYTRQHPAVFPVALPEFIYKTWSQPGDIVYEPFCGSGTSIIAGENLNRKVYACEISEEYCELAIKRWQTLTCRKAVQS